MKGVNKVTVRGKTYYYDRRTGERLPDDEAKREARMVAIQRGEKQAKAPPIVGTFADLVARYKASPEFKKLAPNSRREYTRYLSFVEAEFGEDAVRHCNREVVIEIRDQLAATPRAADCMVKVLRRLLAYALDRHSQYGLEFNPARDVKAINTNHPHEAWPDDLVAKFRAAAYPELRLIVELGLGTGQRISDCTAMLWSQYDGRSLRLRQKKTRTPLVIPVTAELKAALDAAKRTAMVIVTTKTGRPWRDDHLRPELASLMRKLGYPGFTFHGLRKRTGRLLAEAGCTEKEIAAVLGHRSMAMVKLYTEAADQERLASAAIFKLERTQNPVLQNTAKSEGEAG